jgi:hypothetical protein
MAENVLTSNLVFGNEIRPLPAALTRRSSIGACITLTQLPSIATAIP